MLQQKHRLAKKKDLSLTYSRGRGFFSPLFSLKVFYKNQEAPQFAVVISTKVSKKSTARNRMRRIIREFIRLNISKFKPGNYIITVKQQAGKVPDGDFNKEFVNFLEKIKFI